MPGATADRLPFSSSHPSRSDPAHHHRGRLLGGRGACRPMSSPPSDAEVARLMAEFHARGGQVMVGATAYLLPAAAAAEHGWRGALPSAAPTSG